MLNIPETIKELVLKNCGRMPETQEEIDQYLDAINHFKEYEKSFAVSQLISKKYMKKLGMKLPEEIKKEGEKLFPNSRG